MNYYRVVVTVETFSLESKFVTYVEGEPDIDALKEDAMERNDMMSPIYPGSIKNILTQKISEEEYLKNKK